MKRVKVIHKTGVEKTVETKVAENLVTLFPKDWAIVEKPEKPKERKTNKDSETSEE